MTGGGGATRRAWSAGAVAVIGTEGGRGTTLGGCRVDAQGSGPTLHGALRSG